MRALAEGLVDLTPNAIGHIDQCLQCRNCEAVCPSGVPYGRIMEHTRAAILSGDRAPRQWRMRSLFLREVIARPERLRALATGLRVYRGTGMRALAERLPLLRERVLQAPSIRGAEYRETGIVARPIGSQRMRVSMLSGCIMPLAYGRVHRATARVLARNGCEVAIPEAQVCCGALHAHNGDLQFARTLARKNIDAFLADGAEAIVVNSAGCAAAMKEYGQLLGDDPEYSERAAQFSLLVRDVNEFLIELPYERPRGHLDRTVTYQDSCHLAHAQGITDAPREIIRSIPGVRFLEMPHADRCCGAAGVYAMTQPEMSLALLDGKMRDVGRSRAAIVATANPGCMAQLEAGMRRHRMDGKVAHVVELLDRAYRKESALTRPASL
jgi:glycolate oxidase iron-sulfur subunit